MKHRWILAAVLLAVGCNANAAEPETAKETPVRTVVAEPVADTPTPDASASKPTAESLTSIDLRPVDGTLVEQLTVQATKAVRAGKRPYVEMRAGWCPICKRVDRRLQQPGLRAELGDVVLIRVDTDRFAAELIEAGLTSKTIPAFYELDRRGRPTEHWVNGHRWGPRADVPAELRAFFGG